MERIVTARQIKNIDKRAIREIGMPGVVLMERAGVAAADEVMDILCRRGGSSVLIFCGKGNNGGDGFVAARELVNNSCEVSVYLFGNRGDVKGDALTNLIIAENSVIAIDYINDEGWFDNVHPEGDVVIDALLGTGISGKVYGIIGKAIELINSLFIPVVSVDVPSGLNSDTGQYEGNCVRAVKTVTMGLKKKGLVVSPGRELAGEVIAADIGFTNDVIEREGISLFLPDNEDIREMLPGRAVTCNKADCGKVLVISGSRGMTGAAALVSLGCMRVGAGLAVLGIPESLNPVMEEKLTEVMTFPLPETGEGTLSLKALELIIDKLEWADVVALGPGLSRNPETLELVIKLLPEINQPLVMDADALYAVSGRTDIFSAIKCDVIITPHEGEFSRLMGWNIDDILNDRIASVEKAVSMLNINVLLKGSPTLVSSPEGSTYVITPGNPGMATGGSGDVLTGVIAGLAAQGLSMEDAGAAGAYIHGMAGDIAKQDKGEMGLIAGDIMERIPRAVKSLMEF